MSAEDRIGISPGVQILQGEKDRRVRTYKKAGSTRGMFFPYESSHWGVNLTSGEIGIFRPNGVEKVVNGKIKVETEPNKLQNIEDAISQTLHIVPSALIVSHQSYGYRDLEALQRSLDLIHWYKESPITEEEMMEMHMEIYRFLESRGFIGSRDPKRRELADNLLEVASYDSLGRKNDERNVVFAGLAHRLARELVDKNTAVWLKNVQIFTEIVTLREKERKSLKRPLKIIRRTLRTKVDSHVKRQAQTLVDEIADTIRPDQVPTANYLQASAKVYLILTQHQSDNQFHRRIRKIIGNEEYRALTATKSLQEWIDQYETTPSFAAEAIRGRFAQMEDTLDGALEDGGRRMHEKLEKHWSEILDSAA